MKQRSYSNRAERQSRSLVNRQIIKRGIMQQFDPTTYTATIFFPEATNSTLQGIPVACHIDGTSSPGNANCAVLFFDPQNYTDALVLAVYPNGSQGIPTPTPGRVVFIPGYQQCSNLSVSAGSSSTIAVSGGSTGIPIGALGIIYKIFFTSATTNAYLHLAPHGASDITAYASIGSIPAANQFCYGSGLLPIDSSGRIDINANIGNCLITLYSYGYTF